MNPKNNLLNKKKIFEDSWKSGYKYFSEVIKKHRLKMGVEIGVAFGGHSEAILNNTPTVKLFGVDPYKHFNTYNDVCNFSQKEFDQLYSFTTKRLSVFKNRYVHIRKFSSEAVNDIPNNLDFVYIDADHSFEGVTTDLTLWFLKVRENGIIGGHDYGHLNHPGVKKAVDGFFNRFGWKINIKKEGVWWVEKKSLSISFIIPAYNCAKFLPDAINSIFDGNFTTGDEVIIIDDASTDNTFKVIKSLQKKYPSIRIFQHHYNKGSAAAGRNTGIDNSKNDLIFCLDADNVLYPNSIPKLKKYMIDKKADATAFGELHYFKKNIQNITHKWIFKEEFILTDCLRNSKFPGASGNYLFTKQSWLKAGRYNESIGGAYDSWAFGFRQLVASSKMVTMLNSFYYHRYGYESTFIKESAKINPSLTLLQIILPYINLFDERDIDYIMGKKSRYTWFNNLEKYPLRLKEAKFQKISYFKDKLLNKIKKIKISLNK